MMIKSIINFFRFWYFQKFLKRETFSGYLLIILENGSLLEPFIINADLRDPNTKFYIITMINRPYIWQGSQTITAIYTKLGELFCELYDEKTGKMKLDEQIGEESYKYYQKRFKRGMKLPEPVYVYDSRNNIYYSKD